MTQWFLKQKGQVLPQRTLRKLTAEKLAPSNEVEQQKRVIFGAEIRQKLGDSFSLPANGVHFETGDKNDEEDETKNTDDFYGPLPFFAEDDEVPHDIPEADCVDANGKPILTKSLTDVMIGAEVLPPQGRNINWLSSYGRQLIRMAQRLGTTR